MSAEINTIFLANNASVFYGTDVANSLPTGATFVKVPELASYPVINAARNVATVESYDSTAKRKLVGRKNYEDVELTFNYIPSDTAQAAVVDAFDSGVLLQWKFEVYPEDAKITKMYKVFNGYVSKVVVGGEKEGAATLTVTISIDGELVAKGIA
jgi:hypothetical protein